jgi:hypothetical protein
MKRGHIYESGCLIYFGENFFLRHLVIFECKGKIFGNSKSDELTVSILKNSAYFFGHAENAFL